MPLESEVVNELPNSILGQYVSINASETEVNGSFKYISKIREGYYLLKSQQVVYLDSALWAMHIKEPILDVEFSENQLIINTKVDTHYKSVFDTISSESIIRELAINLNEHTFQADFNSDKIEDYKHFENSCYLRKNNNQYFLNQGHFFNYWFVSRILITDNKLTINALNHLESKESPQFKKLSMKYNFKPIYFDQRVRESREFHLAESNYETLNSLYNEELFGSVVWHKLKNENSKISAYIIYLLFFVFLVLLFIKIKK